MIFLKHREGMVAVLMFVVIAINSFRYIFKFGLQSSSSGYSNTPLEFWVIRYLLIGIILLIFVRAWKRIILFEWMAFAVLLLSSIYALKISEYTQVKIAAFHLCLAGFLFLAVRSMKDDVISNYVGYFTKLLYVLLVLFFVFLALQIFLYFLFGNLPSHSYNNSIILRFGSVLDDSLAFGILLPMFAGLLFYSLEDGFSRPVSMMSVILIAILTGSLTAMATTAIYTLWLVRLQRRNFALWFLLISLLLISFHRYFFELWSAKSGSIALHLEGLKLLSGGFAEKSGGFAESGWILLLNNFGIFTLLVMLGFHLYIHLLCLRTIRSGYSYKQYIGAVEGLNFSAFVASFNLPVLMIFPIYFLLAIFSAVLCGVAGNYDIRIKS